MYIGSTAQHLAVMSIYIIITILNGHGYTLQPPLFYVFSSFYLEITMISLLNCKLIQSMGIWLSSLSYN